MTPPLIRPDDRQAALNVFSACSLFLLSASIIALQIALMRSLSIARYHHFSYLVISFALLGFGVSGTFLTFFAQRLKDRFPLWVSLFLLLYTLSIPACADLAGRLPIDIQYLLFSGRQLLLMALYNLIIAVPFFLGAVVIGLSLVHFTRQVPVVYGINLLGSGAGGVLGVGALFFLPAAVLVRALSLVAFLSLIAWIVSSNRAAAGRTARLNAVFLVVGALGAAAAVLIEPAVSFDQYKTASHLMRLEKQSDAKKLLTRFSPRGRIDAYDSPRLHQTLFAGLGADMLPPPQAALLVDGQYAAAVFKITSPDQAGILDFTPQSLPYRLIRTPRVLLLGEVGGANVWLAIRSGASRITVVQSNSQLNEIMLHDLASLSGFVYQRPDVAVISKEPHLFIAQTREQFDIIHLVAAEGMSAGTSGLQSLHEDYLLTVESLSRCYDRLTDRGFISVTRGVQSPPRDNIKIVSLFSAALEHAGRTRAGEHLFQARNYLAANTLITRQPAGHDLINRYRVIARSLRMDAEYYPGITGEQQEQINIAEGPPGKNYSYFHEAAMKMLSDDRQRFFDAWVYDVRPPTDDRPYFYDFFKWRSLGRFFEVYGRQWLQRLELGYVVLVFSFFAAGVAALVFILAPLFKIKTEPGRRAGKLFVAAYFLCLGFAFMFIEMVCIQKFTRFMGDPLYAVSVVITTILVFAGAGSLSQQRQTLMPQQRIRFAGAAVFSCAVLYLFFLDHALGMFQHHGVAGRFLITALLLSPVSFFMGWLFPAGLTLLEQQAPDLIPWAWGVNGFASVSAAPLSVMLSMSWGFSGVMALAAVLYLAAAGMARKLGRA